MFTVKTLIVFVLGIAFVFTGCSDVNNPTAIPDSNNSALTAMDNSSNSSKYAVLWGSQVPTPVISIIGTVHFIQERDGCIYLQPAVGEFPHELNFRFSNCPPDGIRENSAVKVIGRFNPNSHSDCVGGSVFQVHDYVYLKYEPDVDNDGLDRMARNRQADEAQDDDDPMGCCLTFRGLYRVNKAGCAYLEIGDSKTFQKQRQVLELTFQEDCDTLVSLIAGDEIEITGNFRSLDESPCNLGPLFNVIWIDLAENEYIQDPEEESALY